MLYVRRKCLGILLKYSNNLFIEIKISDNFQIYLEHYIDNIIIKFINKILKMKVYYAFIKIIGEKIHYVI